MFSHTTFFVSHDASTVTLTGTLGCTGRVSRAHQVTRLGFTSAVLGVPLLGGSAVEDVSTNCNHEKMAIGIKFSR